MKFVWRLVLTLSAWISLGVHVWLNDMAIEPIPPGEYLIAILLVLLIFILGSIDERLKKEGLS